MTIPDAKAVVDKEWDKFIYLPTWQEQKAKSKQRFNEEALKEGNTIHFAALIDFGHLKKSELDKKFRKLKWRVVLRGDAAKDDSGS